MNLKKSIFGLIFTLLISAFLGAQESENPRETLMNNTWYLAGMIIDGNDMPYVPNEEVPESTLEPFNNPSDDFKAFTVHFCEGGTIELYQLGNDQFIILGGVITLTGPDNGFHCSSQEYIMYQYYYYNFFGEHDNPETELPYPIQYEITEVEGPDGTPMKHLVFTRFDGDQVMYNNEPTLGVKRLESPKVVLYPNPAKDYVTFKSLRHPVKVVFYDLSGKMRLKRRLNAKTDQLPVNTLSPGLYLYQIFAEGKVVQTGKLLKN